MLEAELRTAQRSKDPLKQNVEQMLSRHATERDMLDKSNAALRKENAELRIELDDQRSELEIFKAQSSGTMGLIFPQILATGP